MGRGLEKKLSCGRWHLEQGLTAGAGEMGGGTEVWAVWAMRVGIRWKVIE